MVGVNYNASNTHYDSVHLTPTWRSRAAAGNWILSWTVANRARDEMDDCLDAHNLDPYVIARLGLGLWHHSI